MHEILLIRSKQPTADLSSIAQKVFDLLNLEFTEERESSNYIKGHYFLGHARNVAVSVCHSDGAELPQYPYWVVLQDQILHKEVTMALEAKPESVATTLAAGGFDVFIPSVGWGTVDWVPSGVRYGA